MLDNFSMNGTNFQAFANNTASIPAQKYSVGLQIWVSVMLTFGFCGGALSYILAATILCQRSLRSGSGILIAHTLLTEGTLLFVSFPLLTVQTFIARHNPPSVTTCHVVAWIYYVILQATHWTEMLIAVNRFVAVILPHHYRAMTGKRATISMIVACWTICIVNMTLPLFNVAAQIDSNNFWKSCTMRGLKGQGQVFLFLVSFNAYIPIGVEGTLYLVMFCVIFSRRAAGKSHSRVDTGTPQMLASKVAEVQRLERRLRLAKMLFVGFIVPAICSLLTPIMAAAWPPYVTYPLLHLTLRAVLVVGYAIHPVIGEFFAVT